MREITALPTGTALLGIAAILALASRGLGAAAADDVVTLKPSARPRWEVPVTQVDMRAPRAFNSPAIAVDPTDQRLLALAARLDAPDFGCALYLSGKRFWQPANPLPELPKGVEKCYAPEVAFDGEGNLYYLFVGLHGRTNTPMGAFLTVSGDRGRQFSPPRRVLGANNFQVRMAVDHSESKGRIHLAWLKAGSEPSLGGFPATSNPIMSSFSSDGGQTWSKPTRVSDANRTRVVAPALALGVGNTVHVLYYDLMDDAVDYQGLEGPDWTGKWSLVLSSSTDGGRSFGRGNLVDPDVVSPGRVMLIFTMPAPALAADPSGRLFAAWHDARNGDWDVFLKGSADGGRSWSKIRRINDDPERNGAHQYLPRVGISENGRVDTVFYDRRRDPHNLRNDVYYAQSRSATTAYGHNLRISGASFDSRIGQRYQNPSATGMFEFGSRLGLVSEAGRAVAAWTDTRNSLPGVQQDIFAREIEFGGTRKQEVRPLIPFMLAGSFILFSSIFVARRLRHGRGMGSHA